MQRYPMLMGVDEDRVEKVGGKSAILEEIVRRWPEHNIPPFKVGGNEPPHISMFSKEKEVLRASSELDLFGGCGLHDSFHNVNQFNYGKVIKNIQNPPDLGRIELFAESVGKEFRKPTIISQKQGEPKYWAVVLQHPNNENMLLINYADAPSPETKTMDTIGQTHNPIRSFGKCTHTAIYDLSKNDLFFSDDKRVKKDLIEQIAINYLVIKDLWIVHPDWVSILEMGIYKDRTETYQFTPIRKKTKGNLQISKDKLVFGACEPIKLPIIKLPYPTSIEKYLNELGGLDDYPEFKSLADEIMEKHLPGILGMFHDLVMWRYMQMIEEKYPEGYLVISNFDKNQEFDIHMRNAKAVLINMENPIYALNHNISRLIYKAPVLVLGSISHDDIPNKELITFSCDGSGYTLT